MIYADLDLRYTDLINIHYTLSCLNGGHICQVIWKSSKNGEVLPRNRYFHFTLICDIAPWHTYCTRIIVLFNGGHLGVPSFMKIKQRIWKLYMPLKLIMSMVRTQLTTLIKPLNTSLQHQWNFGVWGWLKYMYYKWTPYL